MPAIIMILLLITGWLGGTVYLGNNHSGIAALICFVCGFLVLSIIIPEVAKESIAAKANIEINPEDEESTLLREVRLLQEELKAKSAKAEELKAKAAKEDAKKKEEISYEEQERRREADRLRWEREEQAAEERRRQKAEAARQFEEAKHKRIQEALK